MSLQLRITSLIAILLLPSCATHLANVPRDAKQPVTRTKRLSGAPIEEQVMACLQQSRPSAEFKVTRVIKLERQPVCGLSLLSSVWTLGLWPHSLPAPYRAEVEGVQNGRLQRRRYKLFLTSYHSTLLWLCPQGREDIKLAKALAGAISGKRILDERGMVSATPR